MVTEIESDEGETDAMSIAGGPVVDQTSEMGNQIYQGSSDHSGGTDHVAEGIQVDEGLFSESFFDFTQFTDYTPGGL